MPSNTRKCAYRQCRCGGVVDITGDFDKEGKSYYHKECNKERKDMIYLRSLWVECINRTVIYSELNKVLNDLVCKRKLPMEYIIFVVEYVIDHDELKLQHPAGLRYYVNSDSIKAAYKKSKLPKVSAEELKEASEENKRSATTTAPTFSVKPKRMGFGNIFGGD